MTVWMCSSLHQFWQDAFPVATVICTGLSRKQIMDVQARVYTAIMQYSNQR